MKLIPLTQGKFAMVDDEDFDAVSAFKWKLQNDPWNLYAARHLPSVGGKRPSVRMHRFILGLTNPKELIDHKDGNGLNNQRKNLRVCTPAQNQGNRKTNSNNMSGYKGVYFDKANGSWRADVGVGGKQRNLGYFKTKEEAALAYNAAAKEKFGEFALLNVVN